MIWLAALVWVNAVTIILVSERRGDRYGRPVPFLVAFSTSVAAAWLLR